ncbi:GEVED domain-containing protein, partial [Lentimicrobium sp.]|uniref:GEVED domain-containing protein n=1 Tax=Lentimicrobium sp. TaxID=2034841 RepID=UPI002C433D24
MKKIHYLLVFCFLMDYAISNPLMAQSGGHEKSSVSHPGYACEQQWIEVLFDRQSRVRMRNGTIIDLETNALEGVASILGALPWHEWYRMTDLPEPLLDQWEINGEQRTGEDLYNLNNIFRLKIPRGTDIWSLAAGLESLPGIYLARPVPKPMPLPAMPPGSYQSQQGYLNAASNNPSGVNALYAWTQTGGTGTGVTVCDLEYSWNYNHADLTQAPGSQINPNAISDPFNDNNHGTAVIGELVSDNNGWGTTGICYGATLMTCGTYWTSGIGWDVPGAIAYAIAALSAGDIILLEQQWEYTSGTQNFIPIEWWTDYSPNQQSYNGVYAAIVTAIANGIHVVEAGGNGNVNTQNLQWYGNSGAIIVGAGGATTSNNLQRLSFSSYGPRFDMQGWGENVFTTGYGTYYSSEGPNYYYRSDFSGTSSASPIVAGALACALGYYNANISTIPPTPSYMRSHLATYGTPQVSGPSGNIGPRADIQAAILNFPPPQTYYDWGDAPDVPYPTRSANNGAYHLMDGTTYMGNTVDAENDGQPDANATGDDLNGSNDDDGVVFTSQLIPGQTASVQVTASVAGWLNAWIDFNGLNVWADQGEFIFQNIQLSAGVNNLTFAVPPVAVPGQTFARFRFNTYGGILFYGNGGPGEVEDYQVFISGSGQDEYDWGDAPDGPYPTLSSGNGARHLIVPGILMGTSIDPEPDGQPDPMCLGDDNDLIYPPPNDDEDGVVFQGQLIPGQPANINVTVSVQGFLNGWFDFNNNGSWLDPGEQLFTDILIPAGLNPLVMLIPPTASTGQTYARFRFSTVQGLSFTGMAPDGEVEDYAVNIEPQPEEFDWGDAPDGPYPTLGASNGAYHTIVPGFMLGASIDPEPDGQPDPQALGDDNDILYPPPNDDEDGVT